jgi:hypothetical protein
MRRRINPIGNCVSGSAYNALKVSKTAAGIYEAPLEVDIRGNRNRNLQTLQSQAFPPRPD